MRRISPLERPTGGRPAQALAAGAWDRPVRRRTARRGGEGSAGESAVTGNPLPSHAFSRPAEGVSVCGAQETAEIMRCRKTGRRFAMERPNRARMRRMGDLRGGLIVCSIPSHAGDFRPGSTGGTRRGAPRTKIRDRASTWRYGLASDRSAPRPNGSATADRHGLPCRPVLRSTRSHSGGVDR